MKRNIFLFVIALLPIITKAQGKVLVYPYIGFYTGSYSGVDSINNKQSIIKPKNFWGKDANIGIKVHFEKENFAAGIGLESTWFPGGFAHIEDKSIPNRVNSYEHNAAGPFYGWYLEGSYRLTNFNLKMPKWLSKSNNYLIVSKIFPSIGFHRNHLGRNFINDKVEYNSTILTSQANYDGSNSYHSNNSTQTFMRFGINWQFYNETKNRFLISFLYKVGLTEAGYFKYHFQERNGSHNFDYMTTTKGSGFCIYIGLPIKLVEIRKK